MPQICEEDPPSFFDTPQFQQLSFHVLTCIEVPIHIFATFVILFKTPPKMKSVKWVMLNLHFWSSMLDISLSFLAIPYILFPTNAGYTLGAFVWLGASPAYLTAFVIILVGMTIVSNIVLYENRYSSLTSSPKVWRKFRKVLIAICYLVAITYIVPFVYQVPDQNVATPQILQKLPSLACFYSGPIFVFTLEPAVLAWVTATKLLVEFTAIGVLVTLTFMFILGQTKHATLSRTTLALQKKFFVALIIQTAIPVVVVLLPLSCCVYSLAREYFNQALNNISFLIISSHGLVSTIAMLLIHEPYREATFGCQKVTPTRKVTRTMSITAVTY